MFLLKSRVTNHRTQFLRQFSVSRQKCEKQPFVRGAAVNLNTAKISTRARPRAEASKQLMSGFKEAFSLGKIYFKARFT